MLRFVVALITFAAGVAAATVLGALLGWGSKGECRKAVYVAPPPAVHSCPNSFRLQLPPPPPPAPLVAPLPPKVTKQTRFSITLPDGSVRVVETKTNAVELKKD
jgi:hypothetical protein